MRTIKSALVCLLALAAVTVSAQPRQHQRGQRPSQERQQSTPEQRAKQKTEQLTKELGLNETQQKQVYDNHLAMSKTRLAGQEIQKRKREEMRAQFEKRHEAHKAEMKKILTSEQFAKWEKMQNERGAMRGGGKDGTTGRGEKGGGQPRH